MADLSQSPPNRRWEWCETHDKRGWADRASADISRTARPDAADMDVYPCTERPGSFHIGHKSRAAIALDRITRAGGAS